MENADSLLTAAKRLATIMDIPWPEVQRYYKALQPREGLDGDGWLPKSIGRNIWYAHPNFIARLLVALSNPSAERSRETVEWVYATTPDGRAFHAEELPAFGVISPIEREFSKYLSSSEAASDLTNVEFRPDQSMVIFNTKSARPVIYKCRLSCGEGRNKPPRRFRGHHWLFAVDGFVFVDLAKSINWRLASEQPWGPGKNGEVEGNA